MTEVAFEPHAIVLGDRTVPEPIWVAGVMGVDRILRVDFDYSGDEDTWAPLALEGVNQRLAAFGGTGLLPAFGRAIGYVVNYRADFAVRFSLDGQPQEVFEAAYRIGHAALLLKGRPIPRAGLGNRT
jgi:hypothetical protein